MGEVFSAHDSRLDRHAAIKVSAGGFRQRNEKYKPDYIKVTPSVDVGLTVLAKSGVFLKIIRNVRFAGAGLSPFETLNLLLLL